MNPVRVGTTVIASLLLATSLQHGLADRMTLLGFRPELPTLLTVCFGLFFSRGGAAAYGLFAGWIEGALALANVGHYIIARAVAGFCVSWTRGFEYEAGALSIMIVGAVGTLFSELLWMFFAAPNPIGVYLADTIRTALVNGLLAVPVYALLKRSLDPRPANYGL